MTEPNDPASGESPPSVPPGGTPDEPDESVARARPDASEERSETTTSHDEAHTRIIRRAPTTPPLPVADQARTQVSRTPPGQPPGGVSQQGEPRGYGGPLQTGTDEPSSRTAVATAAVAIVDGWATSVVATDLIAGWWRSDRLFCVAVGFLGLVFAITTVYGVVLLLQRRTLGRHLIVAGAVVALLTYGGIFIAGARVAWIVHTLPLLPIATVVLALLPQTKRWLGMD